MLISQTLTYLRFQGHYKSLKVITPTYEKYLYDGQKWANHEPKLTEKISKLGPFVVISELHEMNYKKQKRRRKSTYKNAFVLSVEEVFLGFIPFEVYIRLVSQMNSYKLFHILIFLDS
uniref:Uncharacterized protein n=1 Tax=Cacopsylla melanoneura TaxID=428564 RepID=A0A8D9BPB5_9HEMI